MSVDANSSRAQPETNYLETVLGDNTEALMAIREIPLLRQCSDELQKLIFKYGRVFLLKNGDELTKVGAFDQWVYFIINGRLGVFVGDEWVDTISSSLVGERCIFGEARAATLKAGHEGVVAIGVDMALLDNLRSPKKDTKEAIPVFMELISIIVGEIVKRIAEFEYSQLDISQKYTSYIKAEELSAIIYNLKNNYYNDHPKISGMIQDYLKEKLKESSGKADIGKNKVVDTKNFYANCVVEGKHQFIYELSEKIHQTLGHDRNIIPVKKVEPIELHNYKNFVDSIGNDIYLSYQKLRPDKAIDKKVFRNDIKRIFRFSGEFHLNLNQLNEWLVSKLGLTDIETIRILMLVLRKASDYTAQINQRLNQMMTELSRIKSNRHEMATTGLNINVQEYYGNKSQDEMIPFYSQQILDAFIIGPYIQKMENLASRSKAR